LYSMGLRLSEGLNLTVHDIDSQTIRVHIREGKGGKDRMVPIPQRALKALRVHWLSAINTLDYCSQGLEKATMDRGGIQLLLLNLLYMMPPATVPIRSKATRVCPCCQHQMACVGVSRPT
ncbi:tyrosine-type recombinase/integrase, partial [Vibrio lentus]